MRGVVVGLSFLDNIPPVPDDVQEGWFSCRNCELRNALEFGDPGTIAFLGKLVAQGASKLAILTEDVSMPGLALNNHAQVDVRRKCLEGKSTLPYGGESSPLSGFGIILSTRVVRTVHSRFKPRSQS